MKLLLTAVFFLSAINSFAQTEAPISPEPPPGNIKMLPGYVHRDGRHTDTIDGTISKQNGLSIYYDIGRLAGNYALGAYKREKKNLVWFEVKKTNGLKVMIAYLKDGRIYATFPKSEASFIAAVKTNEELADFLNMIMTYGSPAESINKKPAGKQ